MRSIAFTLLLIAAAPRARAQEQPSSLLRFGVVTDLEEGEVGDVGRDAFLGAARAFRARFVVDLGSHGALEATGPRIWTLAGDGAAPAAQHAAGLRYGAMDFGGVRFLRIDGGPPSASAAGAAPALGEAQLDWLRYEIRTSPRPLVLLSHFNPTGPLGFADGEHLRAALRETEPWRVLAWFHGNDGTDRLRWLDGIPVLCVNSSAARRAAVGDAALPCADPLFCLVELDLGARLMHVTGRDSSWLGVDARRVLGGRAAELPVAVRPSASTRSFALPAFGARRYHSVDVRGWWVQFETELLDREVLRAEVHELLDEKLGELIEALPPPVVARLREVPIWMHFDRPGARGGLYHPSLEWLREHELDPRWAEGVEFANAMNFLTWMTDQPSMVLHELAHAWHHQVLGYDDPALIAAFERASAAGRFESVRHANGDERRAYALEDVMEFFAETSEAWWGRNDFEPFDRAALLEFDPETARAIEAAWAREPSEGGRAAAGGAPANDRRPED